MSRVFSHRYTFSFSGTLKYGFDSFEYKVYLSSTLTHPPDHVPCSCHVIPHFHIGKPTTG